MRLALVHNAIILPKPAFLADLGTACHRTLVGCRVVSIANVLMKGSSRLECIPQEQQTVIVQADDGRRTGGGSSGCLHAMELAKVLQDVVLPNEGLVTERTLLSGSGIVLADMFLGQQVTSYRILPCEDFLAALHGTGVVIGSTGSRVV